MLAVGGALRSSNVNDDQQARCRDDLQDDGGFAKLRLQRWLPPPRRQRRVRPPISDGDTAVGGELQGRPTGPIQDRGMTSKTRLVFVRHRTSPLCGLRFLPNSAHKSHRPTTNIRQQPTNKQSKSNHEARLFVGHLRRRRDLRLGYLCRTRQQGCVQHHGRQRLLP